MEFTRFAETIEVKTEKRVLSIDISLKVNDCEGNVYFTDIGAQEGDKLTGYVINSKGMISNNTVNRHHNVLVRNEAVCVIPNTGKVSTGLDIRIYPMQDMKEKSIEISKGTGSHKALITAPVNDGDEIEFLSNRKCLKNGVDIPKEGFYQYTASGDTKHKIKVENKKAARVLLEFNEIVEEGDKV